MLVHLGIPRAQHRRRNVGLGSSNLFKVTEQAREVSGQGRAALDLELPSLENSSQLVE